MYLFGVLFIRNFVLVFILTLLLLSIDFYYLKNIAGRRLVGLRWWNEVNTSTGESHWVFESAPEGARSENKTDKRFFWLSMYVTPALWIGLAILAIVRLQYLIWLVTIGEYTSLSPSISKMFTMGNGNVLIPDSYCNSHRPYSDNHKHRGLFKM